MRKSRIAYLCSADTMPLGPTRREDAFEHDFLIGVLGRGMHQHGLHIEPAQWDLATTDWSRYDAAIIGTTWDYTTRLPEFISQLSNIESQLPLFNSSQLVQWNASKTYLLDLSNRGVPCIPTLWLEAPKEDAIRKAFDIWQCDQVVIKPQVGANAWRQVKLHREALWPDLSLLPLGATMVQPFQPRIATDGEYSLLFFNRQYSHAVVKKPKAGDYRVQASYSGRDFPYEATALDLQAAHRVLDAVAGELLYARVDFVRAESGELLLIELELIEPYLYPVYAPDMSSEFARGLLQLLDRQV